MTSPDFDMIVRPQCQSLLLACLSVVWLPYTCSSSCSASRLTLVACSGTPPWLTRMKKNAMLAATRLYVPQTNFQASRAG